MNADPSAIEAIRQARERTLAAGSARIELFIEHTWETPPLPRRRRGPLMHLVVKLGKAVGRRLWRLATATDFDFRHQEAEGVLDFYARRYMLDYGSYARLYADGREWDGLSGRALSTLPADFDVVPMPLWLLDVLAGATDARDEGTEYVPGTRCRHITIETDLSRASVATPGGVAVPTLGGFEKLLALPVDVWLDDAHVRRARFEAENRTDTLELWDFGTSLGGLDWTRLPTFRTPRQAARLAGEWTPRWKRALDRVTARRSR